MSKSIADLRSEQAAAPTRPSVPHKVTVGQGRKYVAEVQRLSEENDALLDEREIVMQRAADEPRPMGAPSAKPERVREIDARLAEIRDRLAELVALMAEYEGEVTITATISDGEWAQWRIAHPARPQGEPGYREDVAIASGWCDSDALIEDIARYVTAWNGEQLAPGDFEALGLMRPDKKDIARKVVGLYETGDGLGELRRGLSAHLASVTDSPSPAA